jgi:myosin heavy subunit
VGNSGILFFLHLVMLSPVLMSTMTPGKGNDTTSMSAVPGEEDDAQLQLIQASVERLRMQRQQVEKIKNESSEKDASIFRLREQLRALARVRDENSLLIKDLQAAKSARNETQDSELKARMELTRIQQALQTRDAEVRMLSEKHKGEQEEAAMKALEEAELYRSQIQALKEEMGFQKAEAKAQRERLDASTQEWVKCRIEAEALSQEQHTKLEAMTKLSQKLSSKNSELETKMQDVLALTDRQRAMLEDRSARLGDLTQKYESAKSEGETGMKEVEWLQRQLQDEKGRCNTRLSELERDYGMVHEHLQRKSELAARLDGALGTAEAKAGEAEMQLRVRHATLCWTRYSMLDTTLCCTLLYAAVFRTCRILTPSSSPLVAGG